MDYNNTFYAALDFCKGWDEIITLGGGEPTLHPRFFDILRKCLQIFDSVWMATNGSKTHIMYRLHSILQDCDYENFEYDEDENGYAPDYIMNPDNKLAVALSLDYFHKPIDARIAELWKKNSGHQGSHYEIRDVTRSRDGAIAQGRAMRTGSGWAKGCVCADNIIRPDGEIKMCGCTKAPIIGNVWNGIDDKWIKIMESDTFGNTRCYQGLA
jgi:hypothetical protein